MKCKNVSANLYRSVPILTDVSGFVQTLPYEKDQKVNITYSTFPAITKTTPANHVPEKLQQQHLSTLLTTQTLATSIITSAKTKSLMQRSLSKLNNHFSKIQVKLISYRVDPIPNITQTPKLP